MVFGTLKQLFVKTGTTSEKRISQAVIARYRGLKHVTITHGYFFLLASVIIPFFPPRKRNVLLVNIYLKFPWSPTVKIKIFYMGLYGIIIV